MPMAGLQPRQEVVCFKCGGTGHFANGCAALSQQQGTRPMGQGNGKPGNPRDVFNTKLPTFYSLFLTPGTKRIDAFSITI